MDSAAGIQILVLLPLSPIDPARSPSTESSGYDSDSAACSSSDPCLDVARTINDDDISKALNCKYGPSVDKCAGRMRDKGQEQQFRDHFLHTHELAFRRIWRSLGIIIPSNPDELQLKEVADTAAIWCLAFTFSDNLLSHMKEVLKESCSAENKELVKDCFGIAAGSIMKRLLNYLAAITKTDGAFLCFQKNPTLLTCMLFMYKLISETFFISPNKDRENFLRLLADKIRTMLAPNVLVNAHKMREACEDNGDIHNNTRKFMSFIGQVIKYDKVLAIIGLPDGYTRLASVDVRVDLLEGVIPKVFDQILSASKTLKPDLLPIVKMNNTQFMSDEVIRMGLDPRLKMCAQGDENVRKWIGDFVKRAWSRVSTRSNSSTGFFPICWKSPSPDIKGYMKAFRETCSVQQHYVIPDYKLRKMVQQAIINEVISPYEEVFEFANARERSEESNSPVFLKNIITKLYERRLWEFDRVFR